MGEWKERDQHTQRVTKTKDDFGTDIELMKSMEYLFGLS